MRVRKPRKRPALKHRPYDPPTVEGFIEIASRASSLLELRMLWRSAVEWELLTPEVKDVMTQRVSLLKRKIR